MPFVKSIRGNFTNPKRSDEPKITDILDISGGDTIVTAGGYRIHTFTTVGESFLDIKYKNNVPDSMMALVSNLSTEVLMVAGGGGGGTRNAGVDSGGTDGGAGAGAGGMIVHPSFVLPISTAPVVVGAGGDNATDVGDLTQAREMSAGQSSSVSGYTSGGSPGPGGTALQPTQPGDSGTFGFGFAGAPNVASPPYSGGGGAGAGGTGVTGGQGRNGNGGPGRSSTISGASLIYAGGGAGGGAGPRRVDGGAGGPGGGGDGGWYINIGPTNGRPGQANTGGGGGGGAGQTSGIPTVGGGGGVGGPGVVIVRYQI